MKPEYNMYVDWVAGRLSAKEKLDKRQVNAAARSTGIEGKTVIKELTELGIYKAARQIARRRVATKDNFDALVELYQNQVTLSHRTSMSVMLQQYSTPVPIAYLAGSFVNKNLAGTYFEPSAGNGLMTVAFHPQKVEVNEIDAFRLHNLKAIGFKAVTSKNAMDSFGATRAYDGVVTNPPFGKLEEPVNFGSFPISRLEYVMALRGLDEMKDEGRAAIIIGNHMAYSHRDQLKPPHELIFFNYLYHHYHVKDVININGQKLYSRQGTGFPVRMILINGRKQLPAGNAPLKNPLHTEVISDFNSLYQRVMKHTEPLKPSKQLLDKIRAHQSSKADQHLEGPYQPASAVCKTLDTIVPDAMDFEVHSALKAIKKAIGQDLDEFVKSRLRYPSKEALCKALAAEQVDAVAMAIYNIEARGQGFINGDKTGIGKGRTAAAMVRYGVMQGYKPIFLTEKANLFSDLYRDLVDIGSQDLRPLILNTREPKSHIKNADGKIIYQAPKKEEQAEILKSGKVPAAYNFVMATYTQFNDPKRRPAKGNYLLDIAKDNILIMDESHNATGTGNVGQVIDKAIDKTKGVYYLSATWSKSPETMPIYAKKTVISEVALNPEMLIDAIYKGSVPLQEVMTSQLVKEGQMIRRERSREGTTTQYKVLEKYEKEHLAISDNITRIMREIIDFQNNHVVPVLEQMDDEIKDQGQMIEQRAGTANVGIDSRPYFSKVFQVINQMLFSIKAEGAAELAIEELKNGRKPVIAFSSTMESFVEQLAEEGGQNASEGTVIDADFSYVLKKGLVGVLRYMIHGIDGKLEMAELTIEDLEPEGENEYHRLANEIDTMSSGIWLSPIDVIIDRIEAAGYTLVEVTGRKTTLEIDPKRGTGTIRRRKRTATNDAFRMFNNDQVDVLLVNASGSTGASAHAIPTSLISAEQVKPRTMIMAQFDLNINTVVQMMGRIDRTGQLFPPKFIIISSSILAEQRLLMFLQRKLAWLDANTTSNQKQNSFVTEHPDILNKYGNEIIHKYLRENPKIDNMLDNPLGSSGRHTVGAAHKVTGRVAVLPSSLQAKFYKEVFQAYTDHVNYLKQVDEYDLEMEALDLQAKTLEKVVLIKGSNKGASEFGDDTYLEKTEAKVLKKPYSRTALENLLHSLDSDELNTNLPQAFKASHQQRFDEKLQRLETRYQDEKKMLHNSKKLLKVKTKEGQQAYDSELQKELTSIEKSHRSRVAAIKELADGHFKEMMATFKFFYPGRHLNFILEGYQGESLKIFAVCLGFKVDMNRDNPFTPSNVKLIIATTNGALKHFEIPLSREKEVNAIKGASVDLERLNRDQLLDAWSNAIKFSIKDRDFRYIITGNLLQAIGYYSRLKIASFTTSDGEVRKGLLLPDSWKPSDLMNAKVPTPISMAYPLIKSFPVGKSIEHNLISIFKLADGYKLITPSSKTKSRGLFIDEEVLELVEDGLFQLHSKSMTATMPERNLKQLLEILSIKYSVSILLTNKQLDFIENPSASFQRFPPVVFNAESPKPSASLKLKLAAMKMKLMLERTKAA